MGKKSKQRIKEDEKKFSIFPARTKDNILRTEKCKGYKSEDNGCYGSCDDCSKINIK